MERVCLNRKIIYGFLIHSCVSLISCTPTIPEYQPFDPKADATFIYEYLTGKNDDDVKFRKISSSRRTDQRMKIVDEYQQLAKKSIRNDIDEKVSGKYEALLNNLYKSEMEIYVHDLNKSFSLNTNEKTIIEILVTCGEKQDKKEALKKLYKETYGFGIESGIGGQESTDFTNALKEILLTRVRQPPGNDDSAAAKKIAQSLKDNMNDWDIDRNELDHVLMELPINQARLVMLELETLTGKQTDEIFDEQFSGDKRDLYKHLADYVKNIPNYFAHRLENAMKGAGTTDSTLQRVIVTRADWDMVEVKQRFEENTSGTLKVWIEDDTSEDYQKLLLDLIGEPEE